MRACVRACVCERESVGERVCVCDCECMCVVYMCVTLVAVVQEPLHTAPTRLQKMLPHAM